MTPHSLEIAAMLSRDGLYVLGNSLYQGWTGVALVLDANKNGQPGQVFNLVPMTELSTDPELWRDKGIFIAGGPFSVQTCEERERVDDANEVNQELAENELKFWRIFATQVRPILLHYQKLVKGFECESELVQELLDKVEPLDEKDTTARTT